MDILCFDLDGCLVDSRQAISASINHALEQVGLPPRPASDLYRFIGPPLASTFAILLAEQGGDEGHGEELVERCVAAYREDYRTTSTILTGAFAGIDELLQAVGPHFRLAVVTSKPRAFAVPLLEAVRLRDRFTVIHGPDLDALHETKQVTLQRALDELGYGTNPARSAWMIGDRHHDVQAGHACGIRTIAVTWGIGSREELVDAKPTALVDTPSQLASSLLETLGARTNG